MLNQITPVILTYNEAPNIGRTLEALQWAQRVIVMDSQSSDETESICQQYKNTDFIQREFDQHALQWNAAIDQQIGTPWTLALDADYVLSDELIEELTKLAPEDETQGYWISFIYKINGKKLMGSLYPPVICLYRTGAGQYLQDGHTQRLAISGRLQSLEHKIYHDDRKTWSRWLRSQNFYAEQEAKKLATTAFSDMPIQDKLRFLGLAPLVVVPYTLLVKKLLFNGLAGLQYTWQRLIAECCLQIARVRQKLGS